MIAKRGQSSQFHLHRTPGAGKRLANSDITTAIDIFRIAGNKIVEHWNNYGDLGLVQQLGVVPPPAQVC